MKYIIMAGGIYETVLRPRPLCVINGETLIERTIRILRELGVTDIAVSTNEENDCFDFLDVEIIKMKNGYKCALVEEGNLEKFKATGYWCDAFYHTDEPVCYLMGDTFYSYAALKQIVETPVENQFGISFFGTDAPFALGYPKKWQEPLAFKVENQTLLHNACKVFKELKDLGPEKWPFCRNPIAWEFAQICCSYPVNRSIVHTPLFVGVHSFASDVDHESDIQLIESAVRKYNVI